MPLVSDKITSTGDLKYGGGLLPPPPRAALGQENLAPFDIPLWQWRVWNAINTPLPAAAALDDLGFVAGTWATNSPTLQTIDQTQNNGVASCFGLTLYPLPIEYVAGQTVVVRFHSYMLTTLADQSATIDLVAYESGFERDISADICDTAAQSINSTTGADFDFIITPNDLVAGNVLLLRVDVAIDDDASAPGVTGVIGRSALLCDVKG